MTSFKCKICGGTLDILPGATVAECEYCGTRQTLPKLEDDRRVNLYDRANHFRRSNDFDKAMAIYETILNEDSTDAEAYWSLVLCRYGIEYVEDPATHKRLPTVNRAQFTSIFDDVNYRAALEHADALQRGLYEAEAAAINEIQKGILAISQKEKPFDVFICYKETDNNGRRTPDSVLANDLYHQLTQEGFKVFFARITLEDKLGSAYEPYIFAALNSAKVMVVLGTRPEYFKAVWVKNEWSRYLALIKQGQKKMLIPAYKDMDPYDLPEEFSHLQAQDMGKLGFMQDLIRGIKKIAQAEELKPNVTVEAAAVNTNANIEPLLERVFLFLEDKDWDLANEYCEKVLDIDPKNAQAYLGKLMAELHVQKQEALKDQREPFDSNKNFQKAARFADEKLKTILNGYVDHINTRNENARLEKMYTRAKKVMSAAIAESVYKKAAELFESVGEYKDSAILAKVCLDKIEEERSCAEKCEQLFEEYKAAVQNEKEVNRRLISLSATIETLTNKKQKNYRQSIEDEMVSLNERLELIKSEIESLDNERSTLGFFAGKRKKEITEKIDALEINQQSLADNIASLQKKKQMYNTIPELDNEISKVLQQIEEQKKRLEELSCARSSQTIRDELSSYAYGKKLLHFNGKIEVDSFITLGSYPQTKRGSKEDIEWLLLEMKDGKALVISKYALDCKQYNTSKKDVTWETCTLRKWLNNDFINAAFSTEEKAMIPTVTVSADKNPKNNTNPGNATQDQVFLLSIDEVNKYFSSESARQCKPTDYAVANGAYVNSDNGNCWWWLRSPGGFEGTAGSVHCGGSVFGIGYYVNSDEYAVRPALWIDLNS